MNPYEALIDDLFMNKLAIATEHVQERKKTAPTPNTDHIPFDVNKTMNYIKQDQYLRKRKALKNVTPQ